MKGRHLGLGMENRRNRALIAGLGVLVDLDDHDLRAILSRADEGDGTKVRAQKGRYMFFLEGCSLYIPWSKVASFIWTAV